MKSSYPKNVSIIAVVFILCILFLAGINLYISIQFRNQLLEYDQNKIVAIGTICGEYLTRYQEPKMRNSLFRILMESFQLNTLIISDTLNNIIYDSHNPLHFGTISRRINFLREFKHLPKPGGVIQHQNNYLYFNETPPFYLYTTSSVLFIQTFDSIFRWHIFYITISLIFVGFLGIFLIRNLFLPMRYVGRMAEELGVEMKSEDFVPKTFDELYKKLKLREQTIIEFSGYIAHEFRNSIGAIVGLARLIEKGKRSSQDIIRECKNMEELIDHLLDYARPLKPSKGRIELDRLIDDIVKQIQVPERIEVEIVPEDSHIVVWADYELLGNAIKNLLRNAVEAIKNNGRIKIEKSGANKAAIAVLQ